MRSLYPDPRGGCALALAATALTVLTFAAAAWQAFTANPEAALR